jgi:hypothetical protein
MPISFHVDRLSRRVVTRASGFVTFSELSAHLDAEERERALDLTELFDARGATTDITPDQIKQLVRRAAETARRTALGPSHRDGKRPRLRYGYVLHPCRERGTGWRLSRPRARD